MTTLARPIQTPLWANRRLWPAYALVLLIALALVAPFLAPQGDQLVRFDRKLLPPASSGAILGTDTLGRDVLTRLAQGAGIAVGTGLVTVLLSTVIASLTGAFAGYRGGYVDMLTLACLDILLSLPGLLVTVAILGIFGTSRSALIFALVGASWANEARLIRSAVVSVREALYFEAAHSIGVAWPRLLFRYVLPNIVSTLLVLASLNMAEVILVISALSFLGLGTQPPQADWGTMLADSRPVIAVAPWLMLAPGLCIVTFSFLANLAGDSLRQVFDPRARIR